MNLLLLFEHDRVGDDRFVLRDRRAAHVRVVLGARVGSTLRVGLLNGATGTAQVIRIGADAVDLRCELQGETRLPQVDVVLAIPRPKSLLKVLPEIAAFGVRRVILLRTWRVAKPFLSSHVLQPQVYRPLLHDGMMQGRWTHEPEVVIEPRFRPFVEDRAPHLFSSSSVRILGHPGAESIANVRITAGDHVAIALGPEGGWLPYEVDALSCAGFRPVSIAQATLRVETACIAMMGQVELLRQLSSPRGE